MTTRGTTNRNARGSSEGRRRRRQWLVETYRANVDVARIVYPDGSRDHAEVARGSVPVGAIVAIVAIEAACRCYRCGCVLTVDTVTADRIVPGCQGSSRPSSPSTSAASCSARPGDTRDGWLARGDVATND